jgi:uncharacterized protein
MNTSLHRGTALITGGSGSIGAIYADRLARRGHDLILVARDIGRLHALATRLTTQTGRCVETLAADLADHKGLTSVSRVLRSDASITLLLNNACIGEPDHLAHAVAPAFIARGTGTIITIAAMTQDDASVLARSRSLQQQLRGTEIRVQSVLLPNCVMPAEAMVDAALTGLDRGECVTIPSLPMAGHD